MATPVFPVRFTGDGTTKEYSLGFPYLHADDVRVYVNGTLKVLGTDYALVTPNRDSGYATVKFFTAPTNGHAIKFYRNTSLALRNPTIEIGHLVALQALYRTQEQGEDYKRIHEYINSTDLLAGTAHTVIAPCDGYIYKARVQVSEAVTTGGDITFTVEGVAVVGLTLTVADAAPAGKIVEDTPTTDQSATTKVRRGQSITINPAAAFATAGAALVTLVFQPADL